ncbi:hypothetical protein [Bradyrhizobium sp. STM 3562]|uniref:hypothetical protein n=1 Tax=Bradyrhizobium sp. STM 3562 TaxID=578924 RepID=UPI00388E13DB
MTNTACKPCSFPGPIRWLHAGSDLAQPNGIYQCADRASMRSEQPPKSLLRPADLLSVQTPWSNPAGITSTIEIGANIKSP